MHAVTVISYMYMSCLSRMVHNIIVQRLIFFGGKRLKELKVQILEAGT